MPNVTREQELEQLEGLESLQNVFLIGEDTDSFGLPMIWFPEIGLRYLLIENGELAQAVSDYLREAGVRRFKSEREVSEALHNEKWEGWDTCADYVRLKPMLEELHSKQEELDRRRK